MHIYTSSVRQSKVISFYHPMLLEALDTGLDATGQSYGQSFESKDWTVKRDHSQDCIESSNTIHH